MNNYFFAFLKGSISIIFLFFAFVPASGQLSIAASETTFTIDFDNSVTGVSNGQFTGSGFQPSPGLGQIDSDGIIVTGLSDGDLSFGGTEISGDFARGISSGSESTAGLYAFEVQTSNYALGFQPGNNDMTPGKIILKVTNNTGGDIISIDIDYEIWQYNDQNISSSLNLSYSADDISYSNISTLDFASDQGKSGSPIWVMASRSTTIDVSGSPLADGASFYFKWSTDDAAGNGGRDEIALDNISVSMTAPIIPDTDSDVQSVSGLQPSDLNISSLSDTENEAEEVFWFQIEDKGTSDGLPTKLRQLRIVPGPLNNVNWTSQIQGVRIDNLSESFYTIENTDITDNYIDISFLKDEINITDGGISEFGLWVYLKTIGIIDGGNLQFRIDTDTAGFKTFDGSSEFDASFPADIVSNKHILNVVSTELRFEQQPVNTGINAVMTVDVTVEATDQNGNRDLNFTNNISLSSPSGTLTGDPITATVTSGLATWAQGVIPIVHTVAGTGLTLNATTGSLTAGTSNPFDIVDGPFFNSNYPYADSTRIDGFHLYFNVSEPCTVYYQMRLNGFSSPPVDVDEVIAGTGGLVSDVLVISTSDSNYEQIITSLIPAFGFDIYLALQNSSGEKSSLVSIPNVRTSDTDSRAYSPVTQISPTTIPSTADSVQEAVDVYSFSIGDGGTADGAPTYLKELTINRGASMPIGYDYSETIAGVTLKDSEGNLLEIASQTINTNIKIELASQLVIPDGDFEKVTLGVYLQRKELVATDGMALDFIFSTGPVSTPIYGTQFLSPPGVVAPSSTHTIDIIADRLTITSYNPTADVNKDINLAVAATDANGNVDTDIDGAGQIVTVSLGANLNGGQLSFFKASPGATQEFSNGVVSWNNIRYDTDDVITLITSSSTLMDDTTGQIVIGNGPGDLVIASDFDISTDLPVNNVIIQSSGDLTINPGVTLSVSGDFTVDGTLNGGSGTVDFNAGGNSLQTITGTAGPAEFYNITISNTTNNGVVSEIDINLNNTLLLSAGSLFDADGASDDKDFRIVSTPIYTARIGPMGDGAELSGNVIWERSLRTGPAGYRGIGTPIKGQTIANISDDVWVQGLSDIYPGYWANLATYSEPVGTTGSGGSDGWNFYSSSSDNFANGVGTRLYLWDIDYSGEQKFINQGLPVIGNGTDGIAGSGETFSFSLSFTGSAYDGGGWNYLANPYPCELDWDNVNQSGIDGNSVYVYNPDTQSYGTYSAPLGTGVGGASRYVSSGQAFFVKASSGASTLSVSESSKATADGNTFLRVASARASQPSPQINISIKSAKHIDETAVAFTDFATDGYDAEFDAKKLGGGWVNLSSKVEEKKYLAINAMGRNKGVQVVKLNIEAYAYGNYSLSFPQITDFEEGARIVLRDKYLDKSMAVTSSTIYNFNIDENKPETFGGDRFELQFLSPLKFKIEEVSAKAGQEFVVPVYADHIVDIVSTDMALNWDAEALTFVGIEETGSADISDFDLEAVAKGKLTLSHTSELPEAQPDGFKMFSLRFKAMNGYPEASLEFDQESIRIKAINDIEMPFSTKDQLIDILQHKHIAGKVATFKGVAIDKVLVRAEGEEVREQDTDQSGTYTLETYEQSGYTVSASKTTEEQNTGISTLDIIAARRHILQIREFDSPYQAIAADVNMSKSLTALDLLQMRRIVLGMDKANQSGLNWLFIPSKQDLTSDPFSYDTQLAINLAEEDVELDFVAVKIGDVNGSWKAGSSGRRSKDQIELNLLPELEEEIIEVPVIAKDFNGVSGYQFSISWDPNQLDYQGFKERSIQGHFNEDLSNEGILTTMWDEPNGKTVELEDGSVVFTLRFAARSDQSKSQIEINSSITEAVAFDGNLNAMGIKSTSASIDLEAMRNGSLELFQNVPNPFDYSTRISFKVPRAGKVKLSVINMLGEMIYQHEQDYKAGAYSIDWDTGKSSRTIRSGVYMYRLESNGEELVKKMLIK